MQQVAHMNIVIKKSVVIIFIEAASQEVIYEVQWIMDAIAHAQSFGVWMETKGKFNLWEESNL